MTTYNDLREALNVMAGLGSFHDFAINDTVALRSLEFINFLEFIKADVPKILPENSYEITFTFGKKYYITITDDEDDYMSILDMEKKVKIMGDDS